MDRSMEVEFQRVSIHSPHSFAREASEDELYSVNVCVLAV
jgi:hypothetical protein